MFTKFINLPVFITSFIIGVIFIQLSSPATTTVFVYPTPDNVEHIEYIDRAGTCFEYNHVNVECPKDKTQITNIPPQMGRTKPKKITANKVKIGEDTIINKF